MIAFIVTSIIPIILTNIYSYYYSTSIIKQNINELTYRNLLQSKNNLQLCLDSYEDILFQIYTDDNIVELVNKINNKENLAVSRNQLRRTLRGLFYAKDYIKSITIIAHNGEVVFYDQLIPSNTQNSWIKNFSKSKQEIYSEVANDNKTHILGTEYATHFANEAYYLFHLGHRIIDYKDVSSEKGIVVVSMDEGLLREACAGQDPTDKSNPIGFNFIVDRQGKIVSYPDKEKLSKQITLVDKKLEERRDDYERFIEEENIFEGEKAIIHTVHEEDTGWDIVNVSNYGDVLEQLQQQQELSFTVLTFSLIMLTVIIIVLSKTLTQSIEKVVRAMNKAGKGDLSVRVKVDKKMPTEIGVITYHFHHMLERLEDSLIKEKEAGKRQKDAEIAALEAQINPHFLYNTLDTINWMAIDRNEFEISNAISALAKILRYGIEKSNGTVTLREECEWLKQYIFLQQTRLKSTFQCEISISAEVMNCSIHKLILQPFIENAILHGFEGKSEQQHIRIEIMRIRNKLVIDIEDNGRGIDSDRVNQINAGIFKQTEDKNHIGIANAVNRIAMYYGVGARVQIRSELGVGTCVQIEIPLEEQDENSHCRR